MGFEGSGWGGANRGPVGPPGDQNGPVPRPGDATERLPAPRLVTIPRVVMSVLLALAGAGLYVAFTLREDPTPAAGRPPQVRTVSPEPGSLQLRQTEIFVELDPSYTGSLVINGTPIPDDQVQVVRGLSRVSFIPAPGKEVTALPPGVACAAVRFRPVSAGAGAGGTYRWCFNVH